jgi:alkanesulfonate monooxygenase SsuD/methylene tetrahydromethanopterin reductase-like flavin-dependent oxidoreductase (luciferase family)
MPVGVLIMPDRDAANVVDDILEKARGAHHAGVRQLWLGQQLDYDAIALASVIGSAVPGVAVGTSVVPINPRHPLIVAARRGHPYVPSPWRHRCRSRAEGGW